MPRLMGSSAVGQRQQARPLGGTSLRRERRINTVLKEIRCDCAKLLAAV